MVRVSIAACTALSTSGASFSISASSMPARNMNMPEFQRLLPSFSSASAWAASGFSMKLIHREHARQALQRRAFGDIAVAGLGRGRLHAEGHEIAGAGGGGGGLQRGLQRRLVVDRGVGGHDPQHRVRIGLRRQQGGGGDRRGAVAAGGFEQDLRALDAGIAQLLGDHEAVLLVRHHDRRGEGGRCARSAVSASSDCSEIRGQNCLGKLLRETGQSRVPEPPDRMTGTILLPRSASVMEPQFSVDRLNGWTLRCASETGRMVP